MRKCECCGMETPNELYCDRICYHSLKRWPEHFGLWWRMKYHRPKPEPEFVKKASGEPEYVINFDIESMYSDKIWP